MLGDNLVKILCLQYVVITIMYAFTKDWVKSLYWLGATILNVSIIIGLK